MKKSTSLEQISMFLAMDPEERKWPDGYREGIPLNYGNPAFDSAYIFGMDIETVGLNYLIPERKIVSFSVSPRKNVAYCSWQFNESDSESLQILKELLENPKNIAVGHNIKYDINWIRYKYGFNINCQLFDTYVAASLINENREKNDLETIANEYLDDKSFSGYKKGINRTNILANAKVDTLIYNGRDADSSRQLFDVMVPKLNRMGMMPLTQTLMQVLKVLSKMETTGVYVDREWKEREEIKLFNRLVEKRTKLQDRLGKFDPNSQLDLHRVIYGQLGFIPSMTTDKGEDSTGFEALSDLKKQKHDIDIIDDLISYKKDIKNLTSFYKPINNYIRYDGRVHCSYRMGKVKTWRLSCENPNMQQIPRDRAVKGMFAATPGWYWLSGDYSQNELRCAAYLCKEPVMIEAFEKDYDIHTAVMADLKGIAYNELQNILSDKSHPLYTVYKNERVAIKRVNFGILFGIAPPRLQRILYNELGIDYELDYCDQLIKDWLNKYQRIKWWIKNTEKFALEYGFVRMPLGAVRRLPNADYGSGDGRRELRQAINFPIQCLSGLLTATGMMLLDNYFSYYENARVLMNTHDSIESEVLVRPEQLTTLISDVKGVMERDTLKYINEVFGVDFNVPLKFELDYGTRWS